MLFFINYRTSCTAASGRTHDTFTFVRGKYFAICNCSTKFTNTLFTWTPPSRGGRELWDTQGERGLFSMQEILCAVSKTGHTAAKKLKYFEVHNASGSNTGVHSGNDCDVMKCCSEISAWWEKSAWIWCNITQNLWEIRSSIEPQTGHTFPEETVTWASGAADGPYIPPLHTCRQENSTGMRWHTPVPMSVHSMWEQRNAVFQPTHCLKQTDNRKWYGAGPPPPGPLGMYALFSLGPMGNPLVSSGLVSLASIMHL